jgi:hypothetical protein
MSHGHLIIAAVIVFAAHWIGCIAAFGAAMLALPLLLMGGWKLTAAVGLLLVVGTVQSVQMSWLTWRDTDIRGLLRILLIAGIGIPIGLASARFLPAHGLRICLGVVVIAAGTSRLIERWRKVEWNPPGWLMQALLFSGGIIHGAFGIGGATLAIYARYALKRKETFRSTMSIAWLVLNLAVILGMALRRQIGHEVMLLSAEATPLVLVATLLGNRAAARLSQQRFADILSALMFIAGAVIVARSVG